MPIAIAQPTPTPLWPTRNERGYEIPNQPFGLLRPIKVIAIGAGISSISLAHSVETYGSKIELKAYELGGDYGGTWYWNKYPGCRCDIPSINYQMSWSPNPNWREFYATAEEIHEYYRGLVEKYDLAKYFKLNHEVVKARWVSEDIQWEVTVRPLNGEEFTERCDVFINAGGVLNAWKWPAIKGLHDFKGTLCHTARWPKDLDVTGKRVATIYHWIRSPTWITSAFAQKYAGPGGKNFEYTEEQKQRFAENPQESLKYRKMVESELNQRFRFLIKGTPEQAAALEFAREDMKTRLKNNQRLIDAMVPTKFIVGCRRPTPGNGYLEALNEPNVEVYTEMFHTVTEKGFIDHEGDEVEVDVFVCATGFDTSFKPRFPVINAAGVNIQDLWKDYPINSYLSIAIKDTPNYLMYYGPHGPTGHGSGAPMIEAMSRSFIQILKKMQMENIIRMEVSPEAVRDFNEHRELYLKRTAWSGDCSSWFKPGPGQSPVMFPGNRVLIIELLTNPRWEDWKYTYGHAGNRFGYMGNGFTMRELDGRDTTFYYGLLDSKDEQPDYSDVAELYTFNKN